VWQAGFGRRNASAAPPGPGWLPRADSALVIGLRLLPWGAASAGVGAKAFLCLRPFSRNQGHNPGVAYAALVLRLVEVVSIVVEARDPRDGASILIVCASRGGALAALTKFRREGLANITVKDGDGKRVAENDLSKGP
jgi:hypothetical protein